MLKRKKVNQIEQISSWLTQSIGTNTSIVLHTLFFMGIFSLMIFGVSIDKILLILTTAVSLEAIYLAIFIQMTVNKTTTSLANVEEDIDDIQENVDDLQEDVDSLETNVKEISDDYIDDDAEDDDMMKTLKNITLSLEKLQEEIEILKKKGSV